MNCVYGFIYKNSVFLFVIGFFVKELIYCLYNDRKIYRIFCFGNKILIIICLVGINFYL